MTQLRLLRTRATIGAALGVVALAAVAAGTAVTGCEREPAPTAEAPGAGADAAPPPPSTDPETLARRRAEHAAARLLATLMGRLTKALAEGPPEGAVSVCADVAQDLTAQIAREEGVTSLRRTALRVRNPKNAPDPYERAILEGWPAAIRPGQAPPQPSAEVVTTASGAREVRLLRPIVLQGLCVTCHGKPEDTPDAVRAAIAARYPEDRATGYAVGDLRGAVSVRASLADE